MPNLNKVMLMGNLTRDPELRYLPSNMPVVGLGIAVNRRWRSQEGEQKEETTFVDCEAFGRTAEVINQYLKKGRPIYVEGRLRLDQWQDKDGGNRSKLKVIVENFQFIDSRGGDDDGGGGSGGQYQSAGRSRSGASGGTPTASGSGSGSGSGGSSRNVSSEPHQPVEDGDIPF